MSSKKISLLLTLIDGIAIVATGFGVLILHPVLEIDHPGYPAAIALCCLLYVLVAQSAGLLSVNDIVRPCKAVGRILVTLILIFSLLVVLSFAFKVSISFSRLWAFGWLLAMFVAISLNRVLVKKFARTTINKRVAVLGAGEQSHYILNKVRRTDTFDYEIVGVFDDRIERTDKIVAGHDFLGTTGDLIEFASTNQCDRIILAMPWSAADRIAVIMEKLRVLSIDVSLAPDLIAQKYPVIYSDDLGLPLFDLSIKPLSDVEVLFKRCADAILASIALVVLLPVFAITAIAIKLDSKGPVFFVQRRYGINRASLMMFKFRTMRDDCRDDDGEVLTRRNDMRVTRVGRFLRKYSVDELPQLLNVVKGDMSIVGPRPHTSKAKAGNTLYRDAVASYNMRYRVKPGMTGWAQVNGWRGETDTREKLQKRVEHDLYYIDNWTPLLDLVILIRTVWICGIGRNAF